MPRGFLKNINHKMRLLFGLNIEFIFQKGHDRREEKSQSPPLVFIHGSFHAAWCWAERWLPFFSRHGLIVMLLACLVRADAYLTGIYLQEYIKGIESPPVLLGHSFGGPIVQYYLANVGNKELQEKECKHPYLTRSVLVCSVPPSGNSGIVWRYLFSKPIAAFKVTRSLAAKAFQTSLPLCKETFSTAMEDHLVLWRYYILNLYNGNQLFAETAWIWISG
ncbi:hypothetical protein CDL12_03545 [Handroanthus impetiginosus]|uniref:AB hydrolase-1 domain-containing protein n=1 Tax=Handroanthus impetiginosus TaxID=429701 RepID=A0A2G9I294_9LAMI|nr:hypothetical protein CDL12_03545 [Handroanthus impetiginosus]